MVTGDPKGKGKAADALEIHIEEPLRRGYCYEMSLGGDIGSTLCYTVQELPTKEE